MTTEQAIREVIRVWGVSAERRLNAVKLLLDGVDHDKVVQLLNKMEMDEGAAYAAQTDLEETNKVFDELCKGRELEVIHPNRQAV